MANVIGIQFQKNGKMYYFDPGSLAPALGQYVIVDTVRGPDLAEVIMETRSVEDTLAGQQIKKVIRIATPQDIQHASENRVREKEAYSICQKKIAEHQLEMKLVSVEYAFDNSKILFYFTANGRVDFRSLVKDLASVFKTRIELRQIGVRDEARMLGGLGPCGRPICCGTFLADFEPVSIKMAKEQNLSLNPTKISGVCGRLMCCLKYEQDHYEQTRKRMPRVGKEVMTPDGAGTVTELNILKETVFVRITNGDSSEIKEYPLENVTREAARPVGQPAPERKAPPAEKPAPEEDEAEEEEPEEAEKVDIASWTGEDEPETEPAEAIPEAEDEDGMALPVRVRHGEPRRDNKGGRRPKPREKDSRKLGQPVKRENPKKAKPEKPAGTPVKPENVPAKAENAPAETAGKPVQRSAKQPAEQNAAPAKPAGKKAAWAAQLEEAMKSVNQ